MRLWPMAPVRLGDRKRPGVPVRRVQASWAKNMVTLSVAPVRHVKRAMPWGSQGDGIAGVMDKWRLTLR